MPNVFANFILINALVCVETVSSSLEKTATTATISMEMDAQRIVGSRSHATLIIAIRGRRIAAISRQRALRLGVQHKAGKGDTFALADMATRLPRQMAHPVR